MIGAAAGGGKGAAIGAIAGTGAGTVGAYLTGKREIVPENARRLAAEFPERVTVVEIPHAGHALLPEQPEQVEKAILAYLRSRAGAAVKRFGALLPGG